MALTAAAVVLGGQASLNAQLVGLWRFEGDGEEVTDSTDFANHGTLVDTGGAEPERVPGKEGFGNALLLEHDGTHNYAQIPGSDSLIDW